MDCFFDGEKKLYIMNYFKKFTKSELIEAINSNDFIRDKIAQILWDSKSQRLLERMEELNIKMERAIGTQGSLDFLILIKESDEVFKQYEKLEAEYREVKMKTDKLKEKGEKTHEERKGFT